METPPLPAAPRSPDRWFDVLAWIYLAAGLACWGMVRIADRWWLGTLFLLGPRWLLTLPAMVLVPLALMVVGALDTPLEDSLAMAARLIAAGNKVDLWVYPQSVHGFTSFPVEDAATPLNGIETWLADRLGDWQPSAQRWPDLASTGN